MQEASFGVVIPILKIDSDLDKKWLDITIQSIFQKDQLETLFTSLSKTGELLPQTREALINSESFLAQRAENGKYYCGKPMLSCDCCDTTCGPSQGCSCDSCQALQNQAKEGYKGFHSQLMHAPKSWFWKEELKREDLEEYLVSLEVNQRNIVHETISSVESFDRLRKRIAVLGRHLAALSRQCFGEVNKEENKKLKKSTVGDDNTKEKDKDQSSIYTEVARTGIRTMLSFAFQIVQRAWSRGEDIDICSALLSESLGTLQKLPEALLFQEGDSSPLWSEVLENASGFLENAVLGLGCQGVPSEDRKKALVLMFEIAFQYGNLHEILHVVIVAMRLCMQDESTMLMSAPLGNIMKRIQKLRKNISPMSNWEEDKQLQASNQVGSLGSILQSSLTPQVSSSDSLPSSSSSEETAELDLQVVCFEILSYLNDLSSYYRANPQGQEEKETFEDDGFKHNLVFWGGQGSPSLPKQQTLCGTAVEIPIKQICITETVMIILTQYQKIYNFQIKAQSLTFNRFTKLSAKVKVIQIAASLEGSHFLALTSSGEVFSWGSNEHGCLGIGEGLECPTVVHAPIEGLSSMLVTHIACGTDYCAAITADGELYTWGKGEHGRLGHGSNDTCYTPTLVKSLKKHNVVDVACGSGDAHTLAVTSEGIIWSWGNDMFGKLGRRTDAAAENNVPVVIDGLRSVKRAWCGLDFSLAMTEDGKIWSWGRNNRYQLGHGSNENLPFPKSIDTFEDVVVVDLAVGSQHCVAVAQCRDIYFWGSHDPEGDNDSIKKIPTIVGSSCESRYFDPLHVGATAGPCQTFCWLTGQARNLTAKAPFCIDVCLETFTKLDDLLDVCELIASKGHTDSLFYAQKDQICMYALNLLKLQLVAASACGLKPLENGTVASSTGCCESLKAKVISLASKNVVNPKVRQVAQAILRKGWSVLLPTAEERILALTSVLSDEDEGSRKYGKRFMIDVLMNSLVNIGGLDTALENAINCFVSNKQNRAQGAATKERDKAEILCDFIELLLKLATIDSLERFWSNEYDDSTCNGGSSHATAFIENVLCMILRYQRLLFARLFKGHPSEQMWPPTGYFSELKPEMRAVASLLKRYIQSFVPCCKSLLNQGFQKVHKCQIPYTKVSGFLLLTVPGLILREFLVLLTTAQFFAPAVASTCEGVPLLGELLDQLDMFNRSSKHWEEHDKKDLAWSMNAEDNNTPNNSEDKNTRKLSKQDLDDNTKDGRTWVSIHGKVYDLTKLKNQSPCGEMLLEHYSGRDASSVFDSMHHSDRAVATMDNFLIGELETPSDSCQPLKDSFVKLDNLSTTFLDSERNLAFILGLHAGYLSRGVLLSTEEIDKKSWIQSDLFSGGVESSAILKENTAPVASKEDEFMLELLLYDDVPNEHVHRFLDSIKALILHNDMFSAVEFPVDHPLEKTVRAVLAATIRHLNLENEAATLSSISSTDEKTGDVPKHLLDAISSVYRLKLKLIRMHQELNKSYDMLCPPIIEKCQFVFYCLHPASGGRDREASLFKSKLVVLRWKQVVQQLAVSMGKSWKVEEWTETPRAAKNEESEERVVLEEDFAGRVLRQLFDFVCDDSLNLDMLRKCFLYQIKRVKQRLISGYMMQSYILRNGLIPSARYSLLCGWMGMEFQCGTNNRPRPSITNNIELVAVEEIIKLGSVFDVIGQWNMDLLKKTVRKLSDLVNNEGQKLELQAAIFEQARILTCLLGMLTSQSHLDNVELLVHSGIFSCIHCLLGCLEKVWGEKYQIQRPCPMAVVVDETRHHVTSIRNLTGPEMANLMKSGTRVVRGPDWKWGEQDGPSPSQGRVISDVVGEDGWIRVQWDTGSTNSYRMGKEGKYDLKLAEPIVSAETSEDDHDSSTEGDKETQNPLVLLHHSCVTVMQHAAALVCLKVSVVSDKTIRILSGLVMKVLREAYLENNSALRNQQQDWVTLGMLRGLCSSKRFRQAFSQPNHIKTFIDIVKRCVSSNEATNNLPATSVSIQILTLKTLGLLLPCISVSNNEPLIDSVVHQLVNLLGDMLVRDVSFVENETEGAPRSSRRHFQASVTASARGTVAEELVSVLRSLHSKPFWDKSISYIVEEALEKLPRFLMKSDSDADAAVARGMNDNEVSVIAVLALIGGADKRVRLGGMVENEEYGKGIVTRITRNGKISVQCTDDQIVRYSPLSLWKVIDSAHFDVDTMLNSATVTELLPSLLHLAIMNHDQSFLQTASASNNKPNNDVTPLNETIRLCQIQLGLLVAARSLLPHGKLMLNLVSKTRSDDEHVDGCWMLNELFTAALKSSQIKMIYNRNELETACLSLCEYLSASIKQSSSDPSSFEKKRGKRAKIARRPRARRNSSTRLPSPPIVVQQIVEMGFPRHVVERALKEMGDETIRPEMIVTWLLEHKEITNAAAECLSDNDPGHSEGNESDESDTADASDSSTDSDFTLNVLQVSCPYKTRADFRSPEAYQRYVRENIQVGSFIKFKSINDTSGKCLTGLVSKVFLENACEEHVDVLNLEGKAFSAYIRDVELVDWKDREIEIGDIVCVKTSVRSPKYKWGAVNHSSVGIVKKISANGKECQVDFTQQNGWTGLIEEMELATSTHRGISCDGCFMSPLIGPRLKCSTCFNYDLCSDCYDEMGNHGHKFFRFDEPGKSPKKCKKTQKKGKKARKKAVTIKQSSEDEPLTNLKECVDHIFLINDQDWNEHNNKMCICLEMHPGLIIKRLSLSLDILCRQCDVSSATINAGSSFATMRKIAHVPFDSLSSSVLLLKDAQEEYKFIEISIHLCRACMEACIDDRVSIECYRKPSCNGILNSFSRFVASDCQEELDRKLNRPCFKASETDATRSFCQRDSKVFVWGLNDKEQLGGLVGSKIKTPVLSQSLSGLNCQQVVGGSKTVFAVTFSGKAYACGESTNGRLGLGQVTGSVSIPRQIEALASTIVKSIAVHSGGKHAMALTTEGRVYSWGEGDQGQLGHNNRLNYDSPKLIETLDGLTVIEIAAGSAHSAAIVSDGNLYTWGLGEYGRLGHGDTETQLKPKMVKIFSGQRVVQVSCGSRDAQTLCLTDNGIVWSWGDGDFGKLGRGGSEGCLIPQKVEKLVGLNVCKVLCGAQFSLAVTSEGRVYTWGKGDYYRLGHGTDSHVRKPQMVVVLKNKKVIDVAVGALHCLAVTDDGQVYSWGDNDHGQQGNGSVVVNLTPARVRGLDEHKITRVACGSSHSIAWAELNIAPQILFEPVSVNVANDPLGTAYVTNEFQRLKKKQELGQHLRRQRYSLSRDVLQLKTFEEKRQALTLILNSLRVFYARDTLVKLLSDLSSSSSTTTSSSASGRFSKKSTDPNSMKSTAACVEGDKSPTDQFVLSLSKVKLLMSLLKLGFAGRLLTDQCEELCSVLIKAAKADKEIAFTLLKECTSEIEDFVSDYELRKKELRPSTQETPHPYEGIGKLTGRVRIPGAESLQIEFDKNCSTEHGHDILTLSDKNGLSLAVRSGNKPWSPMCVVGDEVRWTFPTLKKGNLWGWRFVVHPQTSYSAVDLTLYSDNTALAVPSLEFARSLLDHGLDQLSDPGSQCNKLIFALSACAQVPSITVDQRCWIFRKLKDLLVSDIAPPLDVPALLCCGDYQDDVPSIFKLKSTGDDKTKELISKSPLGDLIRGLPDAMRKQYQYEAKSDLQGQRLFSTSFLRALVNLGRTLGLDFLLCCYDKYHWGWFRITCLAYRVIESFIKRTPIPNDFLLEVRSTIQDISPGEIDNEYEKQTLFTDEEDKQALSWLQRCPRDWAMSLGGGGNIYGWGHNHRGQLGGLDGSRLKSPQICENLSSIKPMQITGGEQTLFCLTAEGKVYATGYGSGGRLGVGGVATLTSPRLVQTLQHLIVEKLAVHSGGKHCLALTSDGEVFSWGEGDDGKLGHGSRQSLERPRVIETLLGKQIVHIACGGSHSAAITKSGDLYTWGKGRYGRLGHGESDVDDQLKPRLVEALRGFKVIDVACGSGDAQTLCLTADDCVWSWGDGDFGKLGRGGSEGCKVPIRIDNLIGVGICKIECGSQFSLALSKSGAVYTWGKGDYYRLGHGTDDHVRRPKIVAALEGHRVVSVSCGSLHCVVCTDKGEVYTWGDNDEGQLGDGTTNAAQRPKLLTSLVGKSIDSVGCGSAHTIAWSTTRPIEPCKLPTEVPAELNRLQRFSIITIRNRILLLHRLSELFWISLPLLDVQNGSKDCCLLNQANIELLRSCLTTASKDNIFRKIISNTMVRDRQHGPILELNRISVKKFKTSSGLAGRHGCKSVFAQACSKMSLLRSESLLMSHRVWKVKFIGESVDDCGGGYSESIAEMCEELQNGLLPLLVPTPDSRDDTEGVQKCFLLNPLARSQLHIEMFKFLGILIGIAVRTGSPLALNLAEPVWKQLSGASLTLEDILEVDIGFLPKLNFIREFGNSDDVTELSFTVASSTGAEVRLGDKHSKISRENKDDYIRLAIHYRLHEFDQQIAAVREGMAKVIPVPLLIFYSAIELETMVCGSADINLESLKGITSYKNVDVDEAIVTWFWEVMAEFSSVERSLFLRFVWGRARLPRTAADFRGRDFVFQVLDKFNPPNAFLPESYTCFFMLKMPRYTSKKILREKLKYAIHFCKSIDSDDYARVDLGPDHIDM